MGIRLHYQSCKPGVLSDKAKLQGDRGRVQAAGDDAMRSSVVNTQTDQLYRGFASAARIQTAGSIFSQGVETGRGVLNVATASMVLALPSGCKLVSTVLVWDVY